MLSQLTHHATRQLLACEGWLDLGSPAEALGELDQIAGEERTHPLVLEHYWRVYGDWGKWERAYEVAERLVATHPDLPVGWLNRAYAARRMKGGTLAVAHELLHPAAERFPEEPVIRYNLACYCAQLGELSEAREWFEAACRIGDARTLREMALADPDLTPLRAIGYLK